MSALHTPADIDALARRARVGARAIGQGFGASTAAHAAARMTRDEHDTRRALGGHRRRVAVGVVSSPSPTSQPRQRQRRAGTGLGRGSLRYLITLPLLLPLMPVLAGMAPRGARCARIPGSWLRCSAIGFVVFYMLLAYAAAERDRPWLVAAVSSSPSVAGMLCAPSAVSRCAPQRCRRPRSAWRAHPRGVAAAAARACAGALDRAAWIALAGVLGSRRCTRSANRLLLLHRNARANRSPRGQRVFGMTLASQPMWWLVSAYAWQQARRAADSQVWLAAGVALSAGIIATILFFQATGMVRDLPAALGAAEAMQRRSCCSRWCWA
jgi:hypothetical protein